MQYYRARAFTLIEILVALGIFALLSLGIYSLGLAAMRGVRTYRDSATVAVLAQKYMEIARNMPYAKVGTLDGNPAGLLPDQPNALTISQDNAVYQVYYEVTYVSDPSDIVPQNDYKQVKLTVRNTLASTTTSFVTTIAPQNLAGISGGALALQVIDSVGQPVAGATLTITNSALTPPLTLTRTTDSAGKWTEVGLPTSTANYHIVASKGGYSQDATYPSTAGNPNPAKPDATVLGATVTGVSFAIDHTAALTLAAVNDICQPISGVGLTIKGSKLIGTPGVLKYDHTYTTDGTGHVVLDPLEWDNYTPTMTTPSYLVYGSSPIQEINLLPGTSQLATLILGPATPNSLLVIVKDAATGNPIEGATVELLSASAGIDQSKLTAGSVLYQQDFSGGAGQNDMSVTSQYYQDDGNIDTTTLPLGIRLKQTAGAYAGSGWLMSSSFDTGTASTSYTTLTWNPTSQSASTSVMFQVATNNDDVTWNFEGPDGTAASFYTTPGTMLGSDNTNHRYLRYKVYLGTTATSVTPVVSNVTVNYVSGCFAPGQAMYAGLMAGSDYTLVVSMPGYTTQTINNLSVSGNNTLQVDLSQ
jgi:prepilin-type N-terminal cleavage/methylation domain-containing protein